jgi:hypothetical protein
MEIENIMLQPLKQVFRAVVAALGTDVESSTIVGEAPFAGTITSVKYIPVAAITGAATNNRRHAVTNRGSAGLGTNEAAFLAYASGVNAVAFDAKTITLHATAANRVVAAGDVLSFDSTAPGTGIADPGGMVIVEITRDAGTA